MNWLFSALLCIGLVEIAIRLPFGPVAQVVNATGRRALHVVRSSRVSDHWKEKVMLAYSGRMLFASIRLAGLLIVLFGCAALVIWALNAVYPGFYSFMLNWRGILSTLLFATLYYFLRKRVVHA